MPSAHDVVAGTPKCPSFRTTGPTSQRCATPMVWNDRRRVWVCSQHPHMQVSPGDFEAATMAPKDERDFLITGAREIWR
jgi:hypothetical protein